MLIRHLVATLAYRGGKAVRDVPQVVAEFRANPKTRTPVEILAHIGDLLDWAVLLCEGTPGWHDSTPMGWEQEVERFHRLLGELDGRLAGGVMCSEEVLVQGPLADALTHVGQIAMLRTMAGHPVRPENYATARIVEGRVGADQAPPEREF